MNSLFATTLRRPLVLVLLLAAVVRLGFLYKNWNNLDFAPSFLLHAEVARNILNGHWFAEDRTYLKHYVDSCQNEGRLIDPQDFPPPNYEQLVPLYNDEGGYGLLLAGLWKITGSRRWWEIRIIQVLLDVVMCWLLYGMGKKLFGERVGIVAAFLYALFIPGIELAVRPHRDIWVTFLFIFTAYQLLSLGHGRGTIWRLLSIGIATGLVAWMRSTVLLFVVFLIPLLLVMRPRKEVLRSSIVLLIGFLLTFSPLIIRNYVVFDKFMATRGAFWHSFWAGVGQTPNPFNVRDDDQTIVRFAQAIDSTAQLDTDHYEQVLKQKALTFVGEHPLWYAGSVAKRAAVFVFPKIGRELFFQPQLPQHVTGTMNVTFGKAVLVLLDGCVSGLFLAGIWISRRRWKELLVLGYAYLYTLVTLAPFYLAGRNIMNVYFVVLLLASVALVHIWHQLIPSSNPPSYHPDAAA
jgi:4-amino-4-deoxy-L-arabinose transferase-like glycosyltransferase